MKFNIKKSNKNKSPKRFQKKAKKELNLVLDLLKKLDIKKKEQTPMSSQNKKTNIILKEIKYNKIEIKNKKKIIVNKNKFSK